MQNTVHCPIVSVDPKTTQQSKKPAEDKRSSLFWYLPKKKVLWHCHQDRQLHQPRDPGHPEADHGSPIKLNLSGSIPGTGLQTYFCLIFTLGD
jgi:hypothetical protein